MKKTMKAIGLIQNPELGNIPNEIKELNVPIPEFGREEVLVKTFASALHVDELWAAQGTASGRFYGTKRVSKEKPYIMGMSLSGVIVKKGDEVTEFNVGDEVVNILNVKGERDSWAEYRKLDKKYIMLKPEEFSHKEAAAMIVAGCVAFSMLLYSKVKKGDQCLVLGASGGIGMVITQMLKVKGAVVTGLCSTRNIDAVKDNGADVIIDYKKEQFSEKLMRQNKKMDIVFDSVGGEGYENESMKFLKKNGKFITVVGPERHIGEKKLGWGRVIGIMWYLIRRSIFSRINGPQYIFPIKFPHHIMEEMFEFVVKNKIKVPFDSVIPLEQKQISKALGRLASHKATGRIVIEIGTGISPKTCGNSHVSI